MKMLLKMLLALAPLVILIIILVAPTHAYAAELTEQQISATYKEIYRTDSAYRLGLFLVTTYADTPEDQGVYVGQTSTGATPTIGRTVAVDPAVIPYGTWVFVEGAGFFQAEDCGPGIKGNHIDLLVKRSGATYTDRLVWRVPESEEANGR